MSRSDAARGNDIAQIFAFLLAVSFWPAIWWTNSPKPIMAFSGVRNSWLICARKVDFALLATSAPFSAAAVEACSSWIARAILERADSGDVCRQIRCWAAA